MEDGGGAAPDGKSGWDPAAPVTPCDCPRGLKVARQDRFAHAVLEGGRN